MPFKIIRNDLTHMSVDMIVNTANPQPMIGRGTDAAIYAAAGAERLLKARRRIGEIAPGQTAVTAAYALPAKYIAHTVSPVWDGTQEAGERLAECYDTALRMARLKRCRSIAFPLLGAGSNGYPKELALKIALERIAACLLQQDMMIYLTVYNSQVVRLSEQLFDTIESYIDDAYVEQTKPSLFCGQFPEEMIPEETIRDEAFREEEFWEMPMQSNPSVRAPRETSGPGNEPAPCAPRAESRAKTPVPNLFGGGARKKRSLESIVNQQEETFQQMLLRLIRERGLTNAQAYKKANQDKKLFSKILHNVDYQPSKKTAMAFAIALQLNLDEARDLLARAGYAFSPSSTFDKIVSYFIENEAYDIYTIEIALYDHGQDSLCSY